MIRKELVPSGRQNPSRVLGKVHVRDARLMRQVLPDRGQPVAIVRQRKLRNGSIFLPDEQGSRFRRVAQRRTPGRHVLTDGRPVLARVAAQPDANGSAGKRGERIANL